LQASLVERCVPSIEREPDHEQHRYQSNRDERHRNTALKAQRLSLRPRVQ
jgi:hypothetical protein